MTRHTMGSWSLTDDSLDLGPGCAVAGSPVGTGRDPAVEVTTALKAQIEPGWRHFAACGGTDPDGWFEPEPGPEDASDRRPSMSGASVAVELLEMCAGCPARRSCLASALLHDESGVWAGTTPAKRAEAAAMLADGQPADTVIDELLTLAQRQAGTAHRSAAETAPQPGRAA